MTGKEYQEKAMKYCCSVDSLVTSILGMCGESGECADMYKKHAFQGHDFNNEEFLLELGDVLWYVTSACEKMGTNLEEVMQKNLDKLARRYPNGYSHEASINRK